MELDDGSDPDGDLSGMFRVLAGQEEVTPDPDAAFDRGLREGGGPRVLARFADDLERRLEDHDAGRWHLGHLFDEDIVLPRPGADRSLLAHLARRAREASAAGPPPDRMPGHDALGRPLRWGFDLEPPRVGRFPGPAAARRAVAEVLAAHERTVLDWVAGRDPAPRLHLWADLGRPVGHVVRRPPAHVVAPPRAPRYAWATGGDEPEPVTAAVVLLIRERGPVRGYRIGAAHPEPPPDPAVRRRWPDLAAVLGGWLGSGWRDLSADSPWFAEWSAQEALTDGPDAGATRARVVAALDDLLRLDDAGLAAAVDALGSHLQPRDLRRWVHFLRRRTAEVDWTLRPGPPGFPWCPPRGPEAGDGEPGRAS